MRTAGQHWALDATTTLGAPVEDAEATSSATPCIERKPRERCSISPEVVPWKRSWNTKDGQMPVCRRISRLQGWSAPAGRSRGGGR